MNTKRIEEIQKETAYPDSISVQQALLKVWNECEQEKAVNKNDLLPGSSQHSTMDIDFTKLAEDYLKSGDAFTVHALGVRDFAKWLNDNLAL
jgi:hypothetical protein